ncbi:putative phage integrase, catalytic core [Phaeobacter inhibens]|uniref:tyrosine-type recombinase/integrase n=1 Tax=Phaeobacter inhibens TaxID=221822 RepID=UPI000C9CB7F5|nr:integrase arm-type DNA-binding domain-containing protein [Phaeobacter inhibens]AUQ59749.1 putative phage integrase, catalytic core [Phaeobacter inhibens]
MPPTNRTRLTDTVVKSASLPAGKKEAVVWDADVRGFGLRIRERGKSYIIMYRPQGAGRNVNSKRLKIGTPETISSVREARKIARAELGKVASGGDPSADRKEASRRSAGTVAAVLDRYEAHLERRQYVTRKDVLSLLRRRLAPVQHRALDGIKSWELAEMIERLDAQSAGSKGQTFRSRLNAFLNWCAFEARVIEANPLAGYRRARDTRAERVARVGRGRALSDEELAAVWSAASPGEPFGRLVRFLILTGCRRNEGGRLRWEMVDLDNGRIDLPATFTKQARGHTVLVAPALHELLNSCAIDARGPEWVFPALRTGQPMSGWSKIMDRNNRRAQNNTSGKGTGFVAVSGVDFSLHDLRRTFRTGLSRLGVDREIAELALGHAREDLEARYNRDGCEVALRAAFRKWSEHVRSITDSPNSDVFG